MAKYRIVQFSDGTYGAQVRFLWLFWGNFVDLTDPERYTWPAKYAHWTRGTREQAERAAQIRCPSWVPV